MSAGLPAACSNSCKDSLPTLISPVPIYVQFKPRSARILFIAAYVDYVRLTQGIILSDWPCDFSALLARTRGGFHIAGGQAFVQKQLGNDCAQPLACRVVRIAFVPMLHYIIGWQSERQGQKLDTPGAGDQFPELLGNNGQAI